MKQKYIFLFLIIVALFSSCGKTYNVSFYDGDTLITSYNVQANKSHSFPEVQDNKDGCKFAGWTIGDIIVPATQTTFKHKFSEQGYTYVTNWSSQYLTIDSYGAIDAKDSIENIESITIPSKLDGIDVTTIMDHAFREYESLTEVTIPDSVTSIGYAAFAKCPSLTKITIPDSVTEIGEAAFLECTSLTEITIPDSVTEIGEGTFQKCTSLTEIIIPDSVTSIGDYVFFNCTSLTEITIPDSVTSIGYGAFADCSSLKSIYIDREKNSVSFGSSWKPGQAKVYWKGEF